MQDSLLPFPAHLPYSSVTVGTAGVCGAVEVPTLVHSHSPPGIATVRSASEAMQDSEPSVFRKLVQHSGVVGTPHGGDAVENAVPVHGQVSIVRIRAVRSDEGVKNRKAPCTVHLEYRPIPWITGRAALGGSAKQVSGIVRDQALGGEAAG